jgi:hypothetical protein
MSSVEMIRIIIPSTSTTWGIREAALEFICTHRTIGPELEANSAAQRLVRKEFRRPIHSPEARTALLASGEVMHVSPACRADNKFKQSVVRKHLHTDLAI